MDKKKYILVCEDNRTLNSNISASIKKKCEKEEINVVLISTYTRDETLDLIDQQYFSLAIIDLNLQEELPITWTDTDGIKIIKKINNKNFDTKIIVASANPETELVFDLTKNFKISNYIRKGGGIDAFSTMINTIMDVLRATSFPKPSDSSELFMGIEGKELYKIESSFCDALNILHSNRPSIVNKVINKIYPCEYRDGHHIVPNKAYNYVKTVMWSYKYASFVGILIQNSNANDIDPRSIFEESIVENLLSTTSRRIQIDIFKLNL